MKTSKLRWFVPLTETTAATITIDPKTFAIDLAVTGVSGIKTHHACELGLALLEASAIAGHTRAERGVPAPPRITISRAGGYDPSLPRDHPNNLDPTLERVDDREAPADEPSPNFLAEAPALNYTNEKNGAAIVQAMPVAKGDQIEVQRATGWCDAVVEFVKGGAIRYRLADELGDFFEFVSSSDEGKTWRRAT